MFDYYKAWDKFADVSILDQIYSHYFPIYRKLLRMLKKMMIQTKKMVTLFPPQILMLSRFQNLPLKLRCWNEPVVLSLTPNWSSKEEQSRRALKLILLSFKEMLSLSLSNMKKPLTATQDACHKFQNQTTTLEWSSWATELNANWNWKSMNWLSKMQTWPYPSMPTTWKVFKEEALPHITPKDLELREKTSCTLWPSSTLIQSETTLRRSIKESRRLKLRHMKSWRERSYIHQESITIRAKMLMMPRGMVSTALNLKLLRLRSRKWTSMLKSS